MLDSKSVFTRKVKNLNRLNLHQLFIQRYGIGNGISNLLCSFSGLHDGYRYGEINSSYLTDKIRNFFVLNNMNLDYKLKRRVARDLKLLITSRSYKGMRLLLRLPIRGQRTRTNGSSAKLTFSRFLK